MLKSHLMLLKTSLLNFVSIYLVTFTLKENCKVAVCRSIVVLSEEIFLVILQVCSSLGLCRTESYCSLKSEFEIQSSLIICRTYRYSFIENVFMYILKVQYLWVFYEGVSKYSLITDSGIHIEHIHDFTE